MYENNPNTILIKHNVENLETAKRNVLGGETALWTEQTSEGDLLSKVGK